MRFALLHLHDFRQLALQGGARVFRAVVSPNGKFEEALAVIAAAGQSCLKTAGRILPAIGENFGAGRVLINAVEDVDVYAFSRKYVVLESEAEVS